MRKNGAFLKKLLTVATLISLLGCSPSPTEELESGSIKEKLSGDSVAVAVNSKAPAFAAKAMGGGVARLSDFVGNHVILLEFWSIFCKSCIEEMPKIKALHQKYRKDGLAVLSINTDIFSDSRVLSVLEKAGVSFQYPVLRDTRQEIAKDYNVELLPVTVIIDRSGWIRLYQEGYRPGDEELFEETIKTLLTTSKGDDITLASKDGKTNFAPAGTKLVTEGSLGGATVLPTLTAQNITLGGGKPVLLFFWSLYCNPCRDEFPNIIDLKEKYPGVVFSAVNVDSPHLKKRVVKFVSKFPNLPCIADWSNTGSGDLATAFGVGATPTAILLNGEGKIVYSAEGTSDLHLLEEQLATFN